MMETMKQVRVMARHLVALLAVLLAGNSAKAQPAGVRLDTLQVLHIDFQGNTQKGVIVCNQQIAGDLRAIFARLYEAKYPIERIRPISEYGDDDERSMQANNTSCFCFRTVDGSTKLSKHAMGMAIDVNPLYNPCVKGGRVSPANGAKYARRNRSFPCKIDQQDLCYRLFRQHGFTWGGSWRSLKDYQHFEK
jgi:hypothetical protein